MAWIDSAIQAATAALSFLQPSASSAGRGPAKGSAAIQTFVNQVLSGLDQLKAQVSQMSATQKQAGSSQIRNSINSLVGALSDPAQVYQAKRGDDAAILARGKEDAAQKAAEIISLLMTQTQTPPGSLQPTTTITTPSGQIITVPTSTTSGEGDNTLLILGGIAVVALLLTRRK